MQAQFIVVEGIEGAGKSTAISFIQTVLSQLGIANIIAVREPGGTSFGEALREVIKADFAEAIDAKTEALLMYASRLQLVNQVIKPALAAGTWVVGDRHDLSTRAYQGGGRGLTDQWLVDLRNLILPDFNSDLVIYLDVDAVHGLERIKIRNHRDRFETEQVEFFQRVRQRYLALLKVQPNSVIIDANQPLKQVQANIKQALAQRYG